MENKTKNLEYINGIGFKHTCAECGLEFIGRLNQVYHPKCKEVHNNNLARNRTKKLNLVFSPIKVNERILESLFEQSQENNGISIEFIKNSDFRPEIFTETLVSRKGIKYYAICLFAWTNQIEAGKIHIEKKLLLRVRK